MSNKNDLLSSQTGKCNLDKEWIHNSYSVHCRLNHSCVVRILIKWDWVIASRNKANGSRSLKSIKDIVLSQKVNQPTYSKWFEPRGNIQTIRLHFHTKVYTRYFNVFSRLHFLFTTKRFVPDTCVNKNARSQDNAYYVESWFICILKQKDSLILENWESFVTGLHMHMKNSSSLPFRRRLWRLFFCSFVKWVWELSIGNISSFPIYFMSWIFFCIHGFSSCFWSTLMTKIEPILHA